MSEDNMFENPRWEPPKVYRNFNDEAVKEARRTVSRFALALFVYLIAANVAVFAITTVMALSMGAEKYTAFMLSHPVVEMLLSTLPMYLISLPILYAMVKPLPSASRGKQKLSLLELFCTFLVAEAFMMAGSLIGQSLNASIGSIFNIEINDATADIIMRTPVWLIFIMVVIVAPIVEEFIFRKLMIDKLSRFGDTFAIIISAVAFGLFHGNFYQFFYAAFLGLLLGYVYAKSGNVKYTVIFHMIINFLGSIVVLPLVKYEEILLTGAIPETGAALREYVIASIMLGSYTVLQYAMVIAGIVIFMQAIRQRKINLSKSCEIRIPRERITGAVLGNTGAILFLVISLLSFVASIFIG